VGDGHFTAIHERQQRLALRTHHVLQHNDGVLVAAQLGEQAL
jgi:hypothetical protein